MEKCPKRWPSKPIKYIASIIQGSTPDSTNEDYWTEDDSSLIWVTPADMQTTGDIADSLRHISRKGYHSCGTQLVPQGSTVISTRAPIGKVNYSTAELCTNQGCKSLITNSMDPRFLYWAAVNAKPQMELYGRGTTFMELSAFDLGRIAIPVPPKREQAAIAAVLDECCSSIDRTVSTLESQISLLKRYRASVIHEAVTRGLNPNVPTKPSGVDWIGNIPEDWDVTPLGYLGSFQNGISKDGDSFGEGHPFVSYGDVYSSRSLPATVKGLVKSNTDEQSRYSVKTGDVFFTRTSETASEIAFASTCFSTIEKATFAGFLIRFRPNGNRLNPRYGSYYFRNTGLRNYFVKEMMIVTRASLGQQLLKRLPVLIPSIDEQERIADYLDARTAAIDAILDTKRKQLDILKRRRQSLIYEYVTGKRRVTEEA